ncbi:hypothetical protein [Candidatus Protofrankia californiensis]|uniref:hypothetical protein n=1 Tax=Candidatus Protofrankia californiensis TaxID=1839754 RepID=UPI0010418D6F|nr:hypothetical protein [Candidatus Protofrankia californiensis]
MKGFLRHLGALLTLMVVGSFIPISGMVGTASAEAGSVNTFHWAGENIELRQLALNGTVNPADGAPAALLRIGDLISASDFRLEKEINLGALGMWTLEVTASTMTAARTPEGSSIIAPFTCVRDAGVYGSGGVTGLVLDPPLHYALNVDPATGYQDNIISAVVGLAGRSDALLTLGGIYSESGQITMPRLHLTGASVLLRPGGYSPGMDTPPAYCGMSAARYATTPEAAGATTTPTAPGTTPAPEVTPAPGTPRDPGLTTAPTGSGPAPTAPASSQPAERCRLLELLCGLSGRS